MRTRSITVAHGDRTGGKAASKQKVSEVKGMFRRWSHSLEKGHLYTEVLGRYLTWNICGGEVISSFMMGEGDKCQWFGRVSLEAEYLGRSSLGSGSAWELSSLSSSCPRFFPADRNILVSVIAYFYFWNRYLLGLANGKLPRTERRLRKRGDLFMQ